MIAVQVVADLIPQLHGAVREARRPAQGEARCDAEEVRHIEAGVAHGGLQANRRVIVENADTLRPSRVVQPGQLGVRLVVRPRSIEASAGNQAVGTRSEGARHRGLQTGAPALRARPRCVAGPVVGVGGHGHDLSELVANRVVVSLDTQQVVKLIVIARLVGGVVAVERAHRGGPIRDDEVEQGIGADRMTGREREETEAGLRLVGMREDGCAVLVEELHRRRAVADQAIAAGRDRRADRRGIAPPLDVAEELLDARLGEVAPPVFAEQPRGGKVRQTAALADPAAAREVGPHAAERACEHARRVPRVRRAGLRLHRQCATEGVQAEQRIRPGHQADAGDGARRKQNPS